MDASHRTITLNERRVTEPSSFIPAETIKESVADTEGSRGGHAPLEAHVPTLPLQKSVESKAGKRDFKNT